MFRNNNKLMKFFFLPCLLASTFRVPVPIRSCWHISKPCRFLRTRCWRYLGSSGSKRLAEKFHLRYVMLSAWASQCETTFTTCARPLPVGFSFKNCRNGRLSWAVAAMRSKCCRIPTLFRNNETPRRLSTSKGRELTLLSARRSAPSRFLGVHPLLGCDPGNLSHYGSDIFAGAHERITLRHWS
jgi:hypothetical protein